MWGSPRVWLSRPLPDAERTTQLTVESPASRIRTSLAPAFRLPLTSTSSVTSPLTPTPPFNSRMTCTWIVNEQIGKYKIIAYVRGNIHAKVLQQTFHLTCVYFYSQFICVASSLPLFQSNWRRLTSEDKKINYCALIIKHKFRLHCSQ